MRVLALLALSACVGGEPLAMSAAYSRVADGFPTQDACHANDPQRTCFQYIQLCQTGSAVVDTDPIFVGHYTLDGDVAAITATPPGYPPDYEDTFHFDLVTLTLDESPDGNAWRFDDEYAMNCDARRLP